MGVTGGAEVLLLLARAVKTAQSAQEEWTGVHSVASYAVRKQLITRTIYIVSADTDMVKGIKNSRYTANHRQITVNKNNPKPMFESKFDLLSGRMISRVFSF